MNIRRTVSIAVLALMAATVPLAATTPAAHAGASIGTSRTAEPYTPKWFRKMMDYIGCAGSIVAIKDQASAAVSVTICANTLKVWYDE